MRESIKVNKQGALEIIDSQTEFGLHHAYDHMIAHSGEVLTDAMSIVIEFFVNTALNSVQDSLDEVGLEFLN